MTLFLVNGVMLQGAVTGLRPVRLVLERGGQIQLVYKHAISTLQPAHPLNLERRAGADEDEEERLLNAFDGNGAIEVARGERAVIVVPELPREAARRSAEARIEEAEGLAEAIGIDVVGGAPFACARFGPRPCSARGRSRRSPSSRKDAGRGTADRRFGADPGPAEEPRGGGRAPRSSTAPA